MGTEVLRKRGLVSAVAGLILMFGLAASPAAAEEGEFGQEEVKKAREAYPSDSITDQVSRLEARAWAEYPDTFAGLWIKDGNYSEIFVSFSKDAAESLKRIVELEGFSRPEALSLVKADYSISELEGVQARLVQHRDFLQEERTSDGTIPEISNFGVNIDVPTNTLQMVAQGKAKEYATQFAKSQVDTPVEIVNEDPGSPYCGGRWNCGTYLRGGIGDRMYPRGTSGVYGICTLGFTVKNGSARPVISAGHCGDADDGDGANDVGYQRFYGPTVMGTLFGSVQDQHKGGRTDIERVSVGNGFSANPWVYRDHDTPHWGVNSRGTWTGFTLGGTFCKSGISTGRTCGESTSKTYSPPYISGGNRFLVVSQGSAPGDSGSPLYQSHEAVGVLSGGGSIGTVHGHIEYAEDYLGVVVDTM